MVRMSEVLSQYVKETVKKLVDYPDEVNVNAVVSTKNVILQIKTKLKDCGKVIGIHLLHYPPWNCTTLSSQVKGVLNMLRMTY